jgi:hypothetical protein
MNLAPRENASSKYEEQKIKTCKTMNKKTRTNPKKKNAKKKKKQIKGEL